MAIDYSKTLRGAIAGALAAGVWAAQMPLDKRAFGSDFDDVALLGKGLTRGEAWPARRLGAAPAERSALRRCLRQPRAAPAFALVGARPGGGERGESPHLAAHGPQRSPAPRAQGAAGPVREPSRLRPVRLAPSALRRAARRDRAAPERAGAGRCATVATLPPPPPTATARSRTRSPRAERTAPASAQPDPCSRYPRLGIAPG